MIKLLERYAVARAGKMREQDELRREIADVRLRLDCMDSCFNMADDDALIDSIIYQRNGLAAHHSYLLNRLKTLEEAGEREKDAATPYQGHVTAG